MKNGDPKKIKFFLFLLIGGLILGGLWRMSGHRFDKDQFSAPLQRGSILESVYGIGTVTATRRFQLKSGVTNTIKNIFVKEGDRVQSGQPLMHLEGSEKFRAPFAGTVTSLPFKVGENVFAQSILLNLVDLLDRYILVSLEQQGILLIQRGQPAKLSFEGIRQQSYSGVVQAVYSNDANFLVRIDTPDLPPHILPGMTADVAIVIADHPDVLLAPIAAILGGQVIVQRKAQRLLTVEIQTGIVGETMAEILEPHPQMDPEGGLQIGDRLLIREKLKP